jgi:hypothetical protein
MRRPEPTARTDFFPSSSLPIAEGELPSSRDQQEHRPLAIFGQSRPGCDLIVCRSPFLNMGYRKAGPEEQLERGSDHAVLFYNALGKPIRRSWTFHAIAINRPCLAAVCID